MAGIDRIETVKGLDEQLQGGIPKQHIVIVAGASGSMKSSLTFCAVQLRPAWAQWHLCHARTGEGSFAHMANMGMNIEDRGSQSSAIVDLADHGSN